MAAAGASAGRTAPRLAGAVTARARVYRSTLVPASRRAAVARGVAARVRDASPEGGRQRATRTGAPGPQESGHDGALYPRDDQGPPRSASQGTPPRKMLPSSAIMALYDSYVSYRRGP